MFVTEEIIAELEKSYGPPRVAAMRVAMTGSEFSFLRHSMRAGRAHDVTLYILDQDRVAVIRKPSYPQHLFRTPSGGIESGETFEAGALREAREETGLEIALERYVLRIAVSFENDDQRASWTSHVFTAHPTGGQLCPLDTKEIAEARWITLKELKGPMRQRLWASSSSGLRYRGELDRMAVEEIERLAL